MDKFARVQLFIAEADSYLKVHESIDTTALWIRLTIISLMRE